MPQLKDFALYDIDWNLTPEHAVTMYLEWGNNDWHSEYPPVRSLFCGGQLAEPARSTSGAPQF